MANEDTQSQVGDDKPIQSGMSPSSLECKEKFQPERG